MTANRYSQSGTLESTCVVHVETFAVEGSLKTAKGIHCERRTRMSLGVVDLLLKRQSVIKDIGIGDGGTLLDGRSANKACCNSERRSELGEMHLE